MFQKLSIPIFLLILLSSLDLSATAFGDYNIEEDTIPPSFINNPRGQEVPCTSDYLMAFEQWYRAGANAVAVDNEEFVAIESVLTFEAARDSLLSLQSKVCPDINDDIIEITLQFYAIDACNNTSDTLAAVFETKNSAFSVSESAMDTMITCTSNNIDILVDWVKRAGNAKISGGCSDDFEWAQFFLTDNFGNSRFGDISNPSNLVIPDDACEWNAFFTFEAIDGCRETRVSFARFNIVDDQAPVIQLDAVDIEIDCGLLDQMDQVPAIDNCDAALDFDFDDNTNNQSPDSDDCGHYNFTINRSWTVTDNCGLQASIIQNISLLDTIAPTFVVPDDITLDCIAANTMDTTGRPLEIIDNCDLSPDIDFSDNSNDNDCDKVITRFWEIKDACGNASIVNQTITIRDTIAPTFDVPDDLSLTDASNIDPDMTGRPTNLVDNCTLSPMLMSRDSLGADSGCGESIFRIWTAEDACGNTQKQIQRIIISNEVAPGFLVPNDITLECLADNTVPITGRPTGIIVSCEPPLEPAFRDSVHQENNCGLFTRFWTVEDAGGNRTTLSQLITISDQRAPSFDPPNDMQVSCPDDAMQENTGVPSNFFDDCGGVVQFDFTDSLVQSTNCQDSIFRNWLIIDECGNDTLWQQIIEIRDSIAPVFVAPSDLTLSCGELDDILVVFPNATDNCTSEALVSFSDSIRVDDICQMQIERYWKASDACGNANVQVQNLLLLDTIAPTFVIPRDTLLSCLDDISPDALGRPVDVVDNCSLDPMISFVDSLDVAAPCENAIRRFWTAEDVCGNKRTIVQRIQIEDNQPPDFDVPVDLSVACLDDDSPMVTGVPQNLTDNCRIDNEPTFADTIVIGENCETTISRTWSLIDNCGNEKSKIQQITYRDTSVPVLQADAVSLILFCESDQIDSLYKDWLNNLASSVATDACGVLNSFTLDSRFDYDLANAASIELAAVDTNFIVDCIALDSNLIFSQSVDFVYQDLCGNSVLSNALFQVRDTVAPIFTDDIVSELSFQIVDDCEIDVLFVFPEVVDNCDAQNISKSFKLDNIDFPIPDNDSIKVSLEPGFYRAEYMVTDCGSNTSLLVQNASVVNQNPINITCPDNLVAYVDSFSCSALVQLPQISMVNDDCPVGAQVNLTEPTEDADSFLKFQQHDSTDQILALNKRFEFKNVAANAFANTPQLSMSIQANFLQPNSSFSLFGENGFEIGIVTSTDLSRCDNLVSVTFEIENSIFNQWAQDGQIEIDLVNNVDDSGLGITSCGSLDENSEDGMSRASLSLSYQVSTPMFYTEGATDMELQSFPVPSLQPEIEFEIGTTQVYYVIETGLSADTCSFEVTIQDTIAPQISCNELLIDIDPTGLNATVIDSILLVSDLSDNCDIERVEYDDHSFSCQDAGSTRLIGVTVFDVSGNASRCDVAVDINEATISPSFTAGVCPGDSLQLQSNIEIPEGAGFQFLWTGPNNFISILPNPVIQNATTENSGMYTLEFGGASGCNASATIEVNIEQIPVPEITADFDIVCEASPLVLNATVFSGLVTYEWFESGALFAQTTEPRVTIEPALGMRSYSVRVISALCTSETSDIFMIEAISAPQIDFAETFIRKCEGDDLQLGVTNGNANIEYQWSGPNGFVSNQIFPDIITDLEFEDQGVYKVVAHINGCQSDTFSLQLVVFSPPAKPSIEAESIYCTGSEVNLRVSESEGIRYEWFQDENSFAIRDTNVLELPTATMDFNGFWTVVVDDGLCRSDTSNAFQLIVEETNSISISSNGPVCQTDSIRLNVSNFSDTQYLWQGPGGLSSQENNPVFAPIAGTYNVTVTSANGCSSEGNISVDVVTEPMITAISANDQRCVNGMDNLVFEVSVFPPDEYDFQWSGPNDFSSLDTELVIENIDESKEGVYELTIQNDACTSELRSIEVDVTDIPPPPIIVGGNFVCRNSDVTFTTDLSVVNIDSLLWSTPNGQIVTTVSELQLSNVDIQDQGTYSLQWYRGACLSDMSNEIQLAVLDAPPAPIVQIFGTTCRGENVELFTDAVPGARYEWRGPNDFSSDLRNPIITEIDNQAEGQYSVRIILDDCISAWSEAVLIDVENRPDSPIALVVDDVVCLSSVDDIQVCIDPVSGISGARYVWKRFGEDEEIASSNLICARFDKSELVTNPQELVVFTELNNCLSAQSNVISIFYEAAPDQEAIINDVSLVCDDEPISISANLPNGTIGEWQTLDMDIMIDEPLNNLTLVSDFGFGDSEIFWELSTENCGPYSRDSITISKAMSPILNQDTYVIEFGGSVVINPLNNDQLPENYTLEIVESSELINVVVNGQNLTLTVDKDLVGASYILYRVCADGCPDLCDEAIIEINVAENTDCRPTNLITPNNDGVNDEFFVPCLTSGAFSNNQLIIFNQWGDEVFNAEPYVNNWTGTYEGEVLPVGTYYYVFNLGDGSDPISGFIVIEL